MSELAASAPNYQPDGGLAPTQPVGQPVAVMPPDSGGPDEYRTVFDLNPEPMWICDAQSLHFLSVNQAATLQYGYSQQEFLSMTLEALLSPESLPFFLERRRSNPPADGTARVWRHCTKGGGALEVEVQTRSISFQGRDARLIVARDVTARRQVESLLSTHYALTRLLSEGSDGVVKKALRCLCQSLGFSMAELWMMDADSACLRCQTSWYEAEIQNLAIGSAEPRVRAGPGTGILAQVAADGNSRQIEAIATEPGYRERAATLERSGIAAGIAFAVRSHYAISGVAVLLGQRRNLPDRNALQLIAETGAQLGHAMERNKAEQELRKAEETFQAFFEDAPVPYHEIDCKGTVIRVNRAECELLGLDAAEIIGKPIWDLVAPEEREESRTSVTRKLKERRTSPPFERKYRLRNGDEVVFRVHGSPMTGPSGEMTGIRTAMLDLTEARQSRQQIEIQTSLLGQVQDAILTVDQEFRITYCNNAAEQLFGWSAQEAFGQHYRTIAGTVVSQAEREAIHQEILSRGSWNGEIICTDRTGKQFVVHLSWSVIRDDQGNVQRVIGIHRDLTAPKQMEQALRATEDHFRLAQDALGVGTWEWDFGKGLPKSSDQFLRLYRFQGEAGDFTLEEWLSRVHPEDRARVSAEAVALWSCKELFVSQFRVVWPDGSIHWILDRSTVAFGARGEPLRAMGVSVDITEQKLSEAASAQLAAIVECADASIISTNLNSEVVTWNRGAERMYGYTANEMVGRTMTSLVPADRLEEWAAVQEEWRRGESVNHLETIRLTKSGELIHVLLTISPIRDRTGSVMGMALVSWDITQVKKLESQLAQAQKLEAIGQLAAGIAHEINTCLLYTSPSPRD